MEVYEGIFQVNEVEVYNTCLYTRREGVIDEVIANRDEILQELARLLPGLHYDKDGTDQENEAALKLHTQIVETWRKHESIDDRYTCDDHLFVSVSKREIYESFRVPLSDEKDEEPVKVE